MTCADFVIAFVERENDFSGLLLALSIPDPEALSPKQRWFCRDGAIAGREITEPGV